MRYIIVDGVAVNAGMRSSLNRGKIPIQSDGAEIYFRKIEPAPPVSQAQS